MLVRNRSPCLQLIFLNGSLIVITEFNVSEMNPIYFINVNIINEKSEIMNKFKLKLGTSSRVRFLGC